MDLSTVKEWLLTPKIVFPTIWFGQILTKYTSFPFMGGLPFSTKCCWELIEIGPAIHESFLEPVTIHVLFQLAKCVRATDS